MLPPIQPTLPPMAAHSYTGREVEQLLAAELEQVDLADVLQILPL